MNPIPMVDSDSSLCRRRRWLSFHHVWYSVDLPPGRDPTPGPRTVEGEKESEPRLYLLSVSAQVPVGVCVSTPTLHPVQLTLPCISCFDHTV